MPMCDACSAIVEDRRGKPGHDALEKTGSERRKVTGQAGIHVTSYRCKTCGQRWQYEDDKNDDFAGWRKV